MWFFSLLTVASAAFPPQSTSSYSLKLRGEGLQSLCSAGNLVQLGLCNPHFVECNGDSVALRKCPIRGDVFSDGACRKAGQNCRDPSISILSEETERLANQEQFCASGGGVYTSFEGCSRQALICSPNGRDAIAVTCAVGQILMNTDLSCRKGLPACAMMPTTPIKDFFLKRTCEDRPAPPTGVYKREISQKKCNTWYVTCQPRPSTVHCESGSIFDSSLKRCRPWQNGDNCIMSGTCSGREYQSISLGHCKSVFLYCDALHGKYLHCSQGMVFDGNSCVSPESANCPICTPGEHRPSSVCHQYYECSGNKWNVRDCPSGSAWNQDSHRCERSYTCATPTKCNYGSVVQLSCGKALFCTGNDFEEFKCGPNMRFDAAAKRCVYDSRCNPAKCREGDTVTSADCKTFQLCKHGKYSSYSCIDKRGRVAAPCQRCSQGTGYGVQQLSFPAQCQEGALQAHQDDCSAYYMCKQGAWNYQRCPSGQVWNNGQCSPPHYGGSCSTAREPQCQEGERVVNPSTSDCTRLLECRGARWIEMRCPEGYYYDSGKKNCVPGNCPSVSGPEIIPGRPEPQPPAPPPIDNGYGVQCSDQGKIPDQYDCTRFWQCVNGQYQSGVCQPGSGYNPRSHSCDNSVVCGSQCQEGTSLPLSGCGEYKICYEGKYINGKCNLNKVYENGQCSQRDCPSTGYISECSDGAVQPSPYDDPSVYRSCIGGRWTERRCHQGMIFDFQKMACVPSVPTGPAPPPTCYGGERRSSRSSGGCTDGYEECEYGVWTPKICHYGEIFENNYCRPGHCGNGGVDECMEGADAYKRDAFDCSQYYQCVHGKWMKRPCSAGTVFNERKNVCDWRRDVPECGGSPSGPY